MTGSSASFRVVGAPQQTKSDSRSPDFGLDPIGALHQLSRNQLSRTGDDLTRVETPEGIVTFIFAPHLNQQVLTNPDVFESHPVSIPGPRHSAQRRLSMGPLSANGPEYKRRRRILLEPLKKSCFDFYRNSLDGLIADMMSDWQHDTVRDVAHDMHRFMLQMTSGILFGLERPEVAFNAGEMLDEYLAMDTRAGRPAMGRSHESSTAYEQLLEMAERLETRILALVDERSRAPLGDDLLSRVLHNGGSAEDRVESVQLVGDLLFLFGAAHKTTASALAWTCLLLASHPEVAAELHAEVAATDVDLGNPADLERLPLLDAVLKESLRLLPPVPCFSRLCRGGATLAGQFVSSGSFVVVSPYVTHRLPYIYERPAQFVPERWRTIHPSPYEYIPFSAGPRMCVGAAFSTAVMKATMSHVLRRFAFDVAPQATVDRHVSLVLEPRNHVHLRLRRPDEVPVPGTVAGDINELVEFQPGQARRRRAA